MSLAAFPSVTLATFLLHENGTWAVTWAGRSALQGVGGMEWEAQRRTQTEDQTQTY